MWHCAWSLVNRVCFPGTSCCDSLKTLMFCCKILAYERSFVLQALDFSLFMILSIWKCKMITCNKIHTPLVIWDLFSSCHFSLQSISSRMLFAPIKILRKCVYFWFVSIFYLLVSYYPSVSLAFLMFQLKWVKMKLFLGLFVVGACISHTCWNHPSVLAAKSSVYC